MSKLIKIVAFVSLCLIAKLVRTQTYNFINFNVGEGIEQSDILCLSQAKNGYLLYGSNGGGLGYYDGYKFSAIKEKNGLANNVVFSISVDQAGNIWCATNKGVSRLGANLQEMSQVYGEGTAFYCSYYDNSRQRMLFGSAKGMYTYVADGDSLQKLSFENDLLNKAFINSMYVDGSSNLWVATSQNGLFKVNKSGIKNYTQTDGLGSNFVKVVIETKGKIWVGNLNGLSLIENDTISNFELPNEADGSLTITSAAKYKDQLVFGSLTNHLYFVNPNDNSFKSINQLNGFNYKKVWSVFNDIEGNLWFGTLGQGISKFNPTFTYFSLENGLANGNITTILCDNDQVWIGYKASAGIDIIKENKVVRHIGTSELGSTIVNRITKIGNDVYIGRNEGLSVFRDNKLINIPFKYGNSSDVYSVYRQGSELYVGTKRGLYQLIDGELDTVANSPKDFIFDMIEYNKGELYLASNNGYYVYAKGKIDFVVDDKNFNVGRVRSFVRGNEGELWIATDGGVYIKSAQGYVQLDEEAGLSSDNVYFLQKDGNGHLWVGTNKGVDRVSMLPESNKWEVRNYGKSEGFVGVECNLNSSSIDQNNQMWFGTIQGAYLYSEAADELNQIPPKITLRNIKLNFKDVDWSNYTSNIDQVSGLPSNLELNHQDNNFIFEFVGVSLRSPDKVQYQYQLEGLDKDWLPLTKDRKAVYSALGPGSYTFKLRAKNNDNVWVNEPTTFSFVISPPWYQTTLFYVSVIVLLVVAIYLVFYFRTRNLKRTQEMLTQQVNERTKELREEKDKVEDQKKVIEVANKNITDSINYAKKIQEAILPKEDKLDEFAANFEVLYLPKDVVSGDFYWYDKIGDKLILSTADCTGHGVPGAFMSMIGVNNLNQIILENKETNPSNILIQLNKAIKKVLRQEDEGSESRDGMDISICTFDVKDSKVAYAGAFRPLLYIRDNELTEIKGSRNPIGGSAPNDFVYDLNELEIKQGDVFYMFSDGYPDQFGGPKGKKFMNKRLKQLFIDHHKKSPQEQTQILKDAFYDWMGNEEQVDDILVMVIKF